MGKNSCSYYQTDFQIGTNLYPTKNTKEFLFPHSQLYVFFFYFLSLANPIDKH